MSLHFESPIFSALTSEFASQGKSLPWLFFIRPTDIVSIPKTTRPMTGYGE